MHEYAIAEGVIGIACDAAGGRRVAAVDLRVGHLRQVVPSALRFAFEIASAGTLAEGAELRVADVTPRVLCGDCGAEGEAPALPLACPRCRSYGIEVLAGSELEVESIEVLNEEPAGAPAPRRRSQESDAPPRAELEEVTQR